MSTPRRRAVLSAPEVLEECPPVVSARAQLRNGLPSIFRDPPDAFVMRFLEGLEQVLDPRVAVIDCLAAYVTADLAPDNMVNEIASWLGLEPQELPPGTASAALANAAQFADQRGTVKGLELALRVCFPGRELRLHDEAREHHARLMIHCRQELSGEEIAALARVIRRQCPPHVAVSLEHGGWYVSLLEPVQ
jgi:phage tail-like protein